MMIRVGKIISTTRDKVSRLLVTMLIDGIISKGEGDVRTPKQVSPAGIDSNPIAGKRALYVKTGKDGKYYVFGVLNTGGLAAPGEARFFSTDKDGSFKFNLWLKDNGTVLIGDSQDPADYTNFLVNFNELKTEFNKLKSDHNELVTKHNANAALLGSHVHPYINVAAPANTSASGVPGQTANPNTSNIDNAKNSKIKSI